MFKRRYPVTVLTEDWSIKSPRIYLKYIPDKGSLVYMEREFCYYEVLHVIHYLGEKQGLFIVLKPYMAPTAEYFNKFMEK